MPAGRGAGSPGLSIRRTLAPLALATHAASPEATDDDRILLDRLAERYEGGAEAVAWDAPAADWGRYAAVVLRSTWNCHLQPDAFLAWVFRVEAAGAALWNPAAVVRWNLEKGYLRDIAAAGVPVVPTEWIPRGGEPALRTVLRRRGWEAAVVNPASPTPSSGGLPGRVRAREHVAERGEAPGGTGSRRQMDNPAILDWVRRFWERAEVVMSVCSGARILARAGLLGGLPVTTHYQVVPHLRELVPDAEVQPEWRFIDTGRIITTGGISAGIDGSLHVVARLLGGETARRTAAYMEYDWRP
jgi:hypothetical protein